MEGSEAEAAGEEEEDEEESTTPLSGSTPNKRPFTPSSTNSEMLEKKKTQGEEEKNTQYLNDVGQVDWVLFFVVCVLCLLCSNHLNLIAHTGRPVPNISTTFIGRSNPELE